MQRGGGGKAGPLSSRGGGDEALMVWPLVEDFFAASLMKKPLLVIMDCVPLRVHYNYSIRRFLIIQSCANMKAQFEKFFCPIVEFLKKYKNLNPLSLYTRAA